MTGQKVGSYRLIQELGRGAFGVVFLADEEFDGETIGQAAVKIIAPPTPAQRASIRDELTVLANVRHPHIVGYRGMGDVPPEVFAGQNGVAPVYIALDFAPDGTLSDAYEKAALAPRALLELARDMADGLAYLAGRGLMHRDIKPDNVLRFDDCWKISDLGLARRAPINGSAAQVVGTLIYLAPEAWQGRAAPASDIWALGLCLHEAATGNRMFAGGSTVDEIEAAICLQPVPLDESALPIGLRALVRGCLQRASARRFTASQVAAIARKELEKLPAEPSGDWLVAQSGGARFSHIRDALAAAPAGTTIIVAPGVYVENLEIERAVRLVGVDPSGKEPHLAVIVECGAGNALKIAGDNLENVIIEDIGFRGTAARNNQKFHAVSVVGANARFLRCGFENDSLAGLAASRNSQVALVNCAIDRSAGDGIVATDQAQLIVQGGLFENCARAAIAARKDARLKVLRSSISGCGDGIKLSDTARAEISETRATRCGAGIWIGAETSARILGGVLQHNKQGVRIERGAAAQISGTDARGNGVAWEIAVGAKVSRENTRPA